ncbi:MAG: CpaF/VirB11 family protein, partial [Actinomycetota bacterium]|nr:CpaF/VirB11 family protein [Actinomycetota bacterium]
NGAIPLRRLVKEALRMRPSRIIVGEVRQEEALDLLIALNSGLPDIARGNAAFGSVASGARPPACGGTSRGTSGIPRGGPSSSSVSCQPLFTGHAGGPETCGMAAAAMLLLLPDSHVMTWGHRRQAFTPSCAHQRHLLLIGQAGAMETATGACSTIAASEAALVVGVVDAATLGARRRKAEDLRRRDGLRQFQDLRRHGDGFAEVSDASCRIRSSAHAEDDRALLLWSRARAPRRRGRFDRFTVGQLRHDDASVSPVWAL